MAHEFTEFDDVPEKLHWCSDQLGPDIKTNNRWYWDFDDYGVEQRTGVMIIINNDEDSMAYKLRWN